MLEEYPSAGLSSPGAKTLNPTPYTINSIPYTLNPKALNEKSSNPGAKAAETKAEAGEAAFRFCACFVRVSGDGGLGFGV